MIVFARRLPQPSRCAWRQGLERAARLPDRRIRFLGLGSSAVGPGLRTLRR